MSEKPIAITPEFDKERTDKLEIDNARLRGALERTQWGSRTASQSWLCCPECGAYPPSQGQRLTIGDGLHQPDCSVGEALKEKP